ncbi:hypothetical protein QMO56_16430 [Roseomonas sp. E05]|uniref:hypothetical protein n=1 Tax=Roseomonas sp. E05 TaxID=3046310 RepID=UPI0024B95B80|nr:hypothetical protein [Roseomonas sp. E05]MDJ0389702.1 hypothetical protein [Roseomonas sp. E05]
MVELTPEQRQAAQARGRHVVAATDEQIATLSMQRRVFWMEGRAFLVVRPDGFLETVATLQALLRQPLPERSIIGPAHPPAAPEEARPAASPEAAAPSAPAEPEPAAPDTAPPKGSEPPPAARAERPATGALAYTARLVASYVATNPVAIGELDGLIRSVHRAVMTASQPRQR